MTFAAQLANFGSNTIRTETAVFVGTVVDLRDSIKFGSAVTGAPAMPVAPSRFDRAGALRDSVIAVYPTPHTALIYTTKLYAQDVEDNPKGNNFTTGGPHGWKLTVAGFPRVLATVAKRQAGGR